MECLRTSASSRISKAPNAVMLPLYLLLRTARDRDSLCQYIARPGWNGKPQVPRFKDSRSGSEADNAGCLRLLRAGRNAVNFRFECFLGHEEHEGYTKCTKENHCQGSCMGKVFLCFLFFVFDQYFSGSKARKGASPDRFSLCTFCVPSCSS